MWNIPMKYGIGNFVKQQIIFMQPMILFSTMVILTISIMIIVQILAIGPGDEQRIKIKYISDLFKTVFGNDNVGPWKRVRPILAGQVFYPFVI